MCWIEIYVWFNRIHVGSNGKYFRLEEMFVLYNENIFNSIKNTGFKLGTEKISLEQKGHYLWNFSDKCNSILINIAHFVMKYIFVDPYPIMLFQRRFTLFPQ